MIFLISSATLTISKEIKDSESETHAASAADHWLVDTYEFPGFNVIQTTLPVLSVYSYLLISNGEALIVDPVRDISFYLNKAKELNVEIKGVYLSHSHADFIAGHTEMVAALNVPIYQSHKSGAKYEYQPVNESSTLKIGKATIKFLDTPGHTPDGMCAAVYGTESSGAPELLFTGDVLFVGSVGRPDLLEGMVSAASLAESMYDSWTNKLSKLPDDVMIFPAHGAGSLCGANLSDEPKSTIGKEKKKNPYVKAESKAAFVAKVLQGLPEAPQYFAHNAKINREGPEKVLWDAPLKPHIKPAKSLTDPDKYYVVDLRDAESYAKGHIPNSVNIAARGRLETWVGTMVPWGANLVLAGDKDLLEEAAHRLHRVGYEGDTITMEAWQAAGMPVKKGDPIEPKKLYELMKKNQEPLVVDVRLPKEWITLRIGEVLNLPLNELPYLSSLLDPKAPVVVVCNSAYRSSMAAGILEREGFANPRNLIGGSEAWRKAGYPVKEGFTDPTYAAKRVTPKK
jgi:glyoxylase-like metal-dependent hydrolase (beta-lactamase superfamily II)/rhodanese-related sulfurtransferase